ncbi:hypothetical protein HF086_013287 [Spodoptera exigua]|uniref:Phosphoglycerate mutase n=1 Tax=Spodoptera exigua TaxID=7107 RepID=A0A922MPV5_SPOEX|nr:hypothetical protein HF086_013287 [Spodoptera exigua]
MPGKYKVVMIRHGESEWNKKNLFCGWFDSDLSDKGREEASAAGKALKSEGYQFDIAYTSMLKRAQITLNTILQEIGQTDIPIEKTWRLNERHYGGLTGLNKAETAAKYGEAQIHIWRRSFDVPPPPMEKDHPYYETIVNDPRYAEEPKKDEFPSHESLKLTIERALPYWNNVIINDEAIMELNLPTGIPFVYELDEDMKPVDSMVFLGDEETVKKAMESVANQGKAK